jgi:hypothetical protein
VRIDVIGFAMGSPARMSDAYLGMKVSAFRQVIFQLGNLSFFLVNTKPFLIDQGKKIIPFLKIKRGLAATLVKF